MIELGHKRIALLSPLASGTISIQDRIDGYSQAHIDAGLPVDQSLWLTNLPTDHPTFTESDDSSDLGIRELLLKEPKVTAIFAVEYKLAVRAKLIATSLGIAIPGELSIICFDDPASYEEYNRFFTHIRQAETEMGVQAVELLVNRLTDGAAGQQITLPTELILASSTAPLS